VYGKNVFSITALAVGLMLPGAAGAQTLDLTKRFQVVMHKDIKKMQTDLNKAGQNGIRIVTGSSTGGEELVFLLEKDEREGAAYEHLIISGGDLPKLEQSLGRAASQGFRLLPETMTLKSKKLGSGDIVLVTEKGPRNKGSYEYILLDASMGATMQVTLAGSIDQGYRVLGMLRKGKQLLLVLEKHTP